MSHNGSSFQFLKGSGKNEEHWMRLSHSLFISLCAPAGGNGTAVCCQLCTLIRIHVIVVVDICIIYIIQFTV